MAASGVGARLDSEAVPVIEGAWDLLDAGMYPGGSVRNLAAVQPLLDPGLGQSRMARMLADAQTSGGLLIAVGPDRLEALLSALTAGGVDGVVIGEVVEGNSISW
jgi:selenide,water dikinase